MNRNNLIPSTSTNDLDPKEPMASEEEADAAHGNAAPSPEPEKKRGIFLKAVLAFIIVAAIIGIGILLPIKLIPNAASIIATVFNSQDNAPEEEEAETPANEVVFSASKPKLVSGDNTVISWSGPVREEGQYSLQYPCIDGVAVTLIAADGTSPSIACGTPFPFISFDNTMTLAIESSESRLADVPLSFSFEGEDGIDEKLSDVRILVSRSETAEATSTPESEGNGEVIVVNGGNTSSSSGRATTGTTRARTTTTGGRTTTSGQSGQTASAGKSDLAVRVIGVGTLDTSSGIFIPSSRMSASDRIAVQFEVVNLGSAATGSWSWNAVLPTYDTRVYQSATQASLPAGGRMVYTLGFDNIRAASSNIVSIQADSAGRISESSESNNVGTAVIYLAGETASTNRGANLAIKLIGAGRMEGNRFVEDGSIDDRDRAAVQFTVRNIGNSSSQGWEYEVRMSPEDGSDDIYTSSRQAGLAPGQEITYTVAFDDIEEGDLDFEIEIDPDRRASDSDRSNNDARDSVDVR